MAYQPKSYRKFIAGAAAVAVVAPVVAPVASLAAVNFSDVEGQYVPAVEFLQTKGIQGKLDGSFGTHENITRQDAAIFVAKALDLDTEKAPKAGFTDVNPRAEGAVNALKAAGITNGKTATTFGGGDKITRGELAKWIATGFGLEASKDATNPFTDVEGHYVDAVKALVENEVTLGKTATVFGTNDNATRGQFALFVYRAVNASAELAVGSVSATNSTTLTLTGTGLKNLKAEDVSVSNNTVKSIQTSQDGKTAKVTLNVALVDGEEATVEIGEKSFTVSYKLEVKTITVKELTYDDNTAKQYIKLVVGGQEVTASDLIAAGYDVYFEAFESKKGTSDTAVNNIFKDQSTGQLADVIDDEILTDGVATAGTPVYVAVTVTKGSEILSSQLQKITIKNTDLATETVESVTLTTDNVEKLSTTILTDETATISKIKVKTDGVSETINKNDGLFSAKSSNAAVATVKDNVIQPVAPGKATITVSYGNATKKVEITVASEARKLSSVEVISKDDAKEGTKVSAKTIAIDVNGTVYVKPVDQYGDLYLSDSLTAISSSTSAVTVPEEALVDAAEDETANGIYKLPLTAVEEGSAYVTFKNEGYKVTSNAFKVTTTENATASTYKLELDPITNNEAKHKDAKINIATEDNDASVTYKLVPYTSEGVKLSAVELTSGNITVTQSSNIVATSIDEDGKVVIVPAGTKTGTATVTVTYDGKKYNQTVTVVNEPTKISSVTLKSIASPTYAKTYNYKDAFTYTASGNDSILKNVVVSPASSQPVRYFDAASTEANDTSFIYLDKNADGSFVSADGDIKLGTLVYSFVDVDGTISGGTTDTLTLDADAEGTLVVKVLDKEDKVIKSVSVDVEL